MDVKLRNVFELEEEGTWARASGQRGPERLLGNRVNTGIALLGSEHAHAGIVDLLTGDPVTSFHGLATAVTSFHGTANTEEYGMESYADEIQDTFLAIRPLVDTLMRKFRAFRLSGNEANVVAHALNDELPAGDRAMVRSAGSYRGFGIEATIDLEDE